MTAAAEVGRPLTQAGRYATLTVAFLGWLWAGGHMSTTQLTGTVAAVDLLGRQGDLDRERYDALSVRDKKGPPLTAEERRQLGDWRALAGRWFAWFQCAFLFGAAAGGLVFGRLGDVIGRSKAMGASILTYSAFAGVATLARSPLELCLWWFLACTGVGGMWPNGVALVSEVWSGLSRPMIAGIIGTAANVGLFLMSTLGTKVAITPDSWRWVMLLGTVPAALGVAAFVVVPESPRWLAARGRPADAPSIAADTLWRPPLLWLALLAILLGTIPMIGGWGTASWMIPWSEKTGDPYLKAQVGQARALTGIVGSLLGGWIASHLGRRATYFGVSLLSLAVAQYIFWCSDPTSPGFLWWVGLLGFLSGIYFGWLPLCLPELFPTRVRSTGAGLGFNCGRILTAVTVFATGLVIDRFDGDFARIGRVSSLLFVLGMVGIWFAPPTGRNELDE